MSMIRIDVEGQSCTAQQPASTAEKQTKCLNIELRHSENEQ